MKWREYVKKATQKAQTEYKEGFFNDGAVL